MNRQVIIFSAMLLFVGCSNETRSVHAVAEKLDRVRTEMIRQSQNDEEKARIAGAKAFENIEGLERSVAGFSVPIGTNSAHISFTIKHLKATEVDVLAKEALEDLRFATKQGR